MMYSSVPVISEILKNRDGECVLYSHIRGNSLEIVR